VDRRRGIPYVIPPIGIMVEVPATALTLDMFREAAFFSFGTNDLAQYLAAAARDNPAVAALHTDADETLFRLLSLALGTANEMGVAVSVCGDMAGNPDYTARLLAAGFLDFSMAPTRLIALRSAIAGLRADGSVREND
jgi:phosphotransferase system enzyme I (PtsI)